MLLNRNGDIITFERSESRYTTADLVRKAHREGRSLEGVVAPNADLRPLSFELAGKNLKNADLRGANLEGTDLDSTLLAGAELMDANLAGANLQGADLEGANLMGANLAGADLSRAKLKGINLMGANLAGAVFSKRADLSYAKLWGVNLKGVQNLDTMFLREVLLEDEDRLLLEATYPSIIVLCGYDIEAWNAFDEKYGAEERSRRIQI